MHSFHQPTGHGRLARRLLGLCLWFCGWSVLFAGQFVIYGADTLPQLPLAAVFSTSPALQIPATPQTMVQNRIAVPVLLSSNGQAVAAVGFALDYQESCLLFDATDSNGDGLPDAISGLPLDFAVTIAHYPTQSSAELEVAIYNATSPIRPLRDGVLLTVQFLVRVACRPTAGVPTNVSINFAAEPAASFGDPTSTDLVGTVTGATIPLVVNSAPTALLLNNQSVTETRPISTLVGLFSTTDPDAADSHSYTFTTGVGSTDNGSFRIDGAMLRSAVVFDYESKASYTIRVRTTDSGGLFFEQSFIITIVDLNETPVAVADPIDPRTRVFVGGQTAAIDVLANDSTPIGRLRILTVTQPAAGGGLVINNGATISYTAPNANGRATFRYTATNDYGNSTPVTVSIHYVANQVRGDCNSSGALGAGDFVGVALEIFDANNLRYNDAPAWWLSHTGDYPGSPLGCDANASANGLDQSSVSVTAADLICTVLRFFRHECGSVQAATTASAHLMLAPIVTTGAETLVPLVLETGGQAVAGVAFALAIDESAFDPRDDDGDGLPDAVTLTVPAAMHKAVTWNAAANRLEVALYGTSLPLPTLTDGLLATVKINTVKINAASVKPPTLILVSLSDANGNDLPTVTPTGLFLPLIVR